MKPDKRVEEFAKELSADVRWSSGYGQYENGSKEQQAYIDGVTTAIGVMYIGLTGTPRSKGMLRKYHQDMMSEVEREIEEAKKEGFIAGNKAGRESVVSHMIVEFDLPFVRSPNHYQI